MQAKWDEMFGVKEDEVVESDVKVKKPRKKKIGEKTKVTDKRSVKPNKTSTNKK